MEEMLDVSVVFVHLPVHLDSVVNVGILEMIVMVMRFVRMTGME